MEELVERARHGDRDAFASLVHATSDRPYAIAVRILRDSGLAQDALQATTKATPITIGGHAGRMLDMTIDPDWKTTCPGEPKPLAQYLVPAGVRPDGYGIGVFPGERQRLILLDLGKGDVLGILIDDRNDSAASDSSRFDALIATAMPVIQSLTFK